MARGVTGTGLPRHRTSFVGRERDVCDVVDRIREHPITTLTGTGGAGKTRLAVRAAFEAVADPDEVWFVELAPVTDPARVGEAVARAAGVDGAASSYDALSASIGSRHALLVLDNCEHVLDEVAAITDRLASDCHNLRILATSREPLLVAGEFVITVHGLDAATDAIELFEQRVVASGATIHAGHRSTIERICERLGGLPLAIELAAARVPMFGLHGVEALLDRPFEVLVTRSRSTDERHRTMFAAIDWSYRLLDHAERRLLEWLAVFVGGFELDAALHVAARCGEGGTRVADIVDSLVRKSMLVVDDCATHVRYRMLESIRAFALDQLAARGEDEAAKALHATWLAAITGLPFDEPISPAVERASVRLEREADNWAAAMTTATDLLSTGLLEQLCGPPTAHFLVSRHDLTGVLERAAAICPDGPARRAVACALTCASAGSLDPTRLREWNQELQRLDGDEWSATTHLIQWISFVWEQRIEEGVQWCIDAAHTERFTQDTRDLFHVIATIDRFSLTDSTHDGDSLLAGTFDVIDRTDVAANRVIGRLAAAWALAPTEPGYAMQLAQDALEEIPSLPAFMRLTLPGNVSRFMASLDSRARSGLPAGADRPDRLPDCLPRHDPGRLRGGVVRAGRPSGSRPGARHTGGVTARHLPRPARARAPGAHCPARVVADGLVRVDGAGAHLAPRAGRREPHVPHRGNRGHPMMLDTDSDTRPGPAPNSCDLVALLVDVGRRRHYPRGSLVFAEGDDAHEVLVVTGGTVKVLVTACDGRQVVIEMSDAGELLGELAARRRRAAHRDRRRRDAGGCRHRAGRYVPPDAPRRAGSGRVDDRCVGGAAASRGRSARRARRRRRGGPRVLAPRRDGGALRRARLDGPNRARHPDHAARRGPVGRPVARSRGEGAALAPQYRMDRHPRPQHRAPRPRSDREESPPLTSCHTAGPSARRRSTSWSAVRRSRSQSSVCLPTSRTHHASASARERATLAATSVSSTSRSG